MNIEIDSAILDAIAMADPRDWQEFFETMRQAEYARIRACPPESLTHVQTRVKLIDELEQFIVSARQNPQPRKQ